MATALRRRINIYPSLEPVHVWRNILQRAPAVTLSTAAPQ